MSNDNKVIRLDDYRPSLEGGAVCTACHHEWEGSWPVGTDMELLECPSCGRYHGVSRAPVTPEEFWRCDCRSTLYYLTPEGPMCRGCGVIAHDWEEIL